jgi:hypothetical protein
MDMAAGLERDGAVPVQLKSSYCQPSPSGSLSVRSKSIGSINSALALGLVMSRSFFRVPEGEVPEFGIVLL